MTDVFISYHKWFLQIMILTIDTLLNVFFDYSAIVNSEFLLKGQRVNKEYYLGLMKYLRENICRKSQLYESSL